MKKVYKISHEVRYSCGEVESLTIACVYDTAENVRQFIDELNKKKHSKFEDEYNYYTFREQQKTLDDLREIYLGA